MRIAFVDFARWNYTVESPLRQPLGGSQTALCWLAIELVQQGHDVFVVNGAPSASVVRGVYHAPLASLTPSLVGSFEAVVVLNAVKQAEPLRSHVAPRTPLILWTQHAADQPAVQPLAALPYRQLFDAIAFVSQWQRDEYAGAFGIDLARAAVLRNAAAPAFLAAELQPLSWEQPRLAYTSTPFRGLDLLVERIFPRLRQALPQLQLDVFSSMSVYQASADEDLARYGHLYELCRTTPGIRYRGSIAQPALAEELAQTAMLAYPNHFAETSCIAVLDALASGCMVVSSALGALPESAGGWGRLLPVPGDWTVYCDQFVELARSWLEAAIAAPEAAERRRQSQAETVRRTLSWHTRAAEWSAWLDKLVSVAAVGP